MIKAYKQSRVNRTNRRLSFFKACALTAAMVISLPALAASSGKPELTQKGSVSAKLSADKAIEKAWGVRPISIQLTAAEYMLDFRYKVVDREKAAAIINRDVRPYLIIEKTGTKLQVPESNKIGSLRQTTQFAHPNRNYFMLFVNPGRLVKAGDKVTIVAGDFKLEHVTVN